MHCPGMLLYCSEGLPEGGRDLTACYAAVLLLRRLMCCVTVTVLIIVIIIVLVVVKPWNLANKH